MSWIWTGSLAVSFLCSLLTGQGSALGAAVTAGAQAGVSLAVSLAGSLCLWSAIGRGMEVCGLTGKLARLLQPLLHRVFPDAKSDPVLAGALSGNICANLLGLGNAATPMGIRAAKRLCRDGTATDALCRLVVLNTASIQLIPTTVAAVRSGLGCGTPFDILPAVWLTSICAAGLGLGAAGLFGRLCKA